MTKQTINVGTSPNDNRGDSLRASFQKINANFTELYTALGLDVAPLNLGAFEFVGSVLSTTDSSAIVIDQATTITSNLTVGGDVLPSVANGGDLGSSARPWRSMYVSNQTIYLGGTPLSLDPNTNELKINNVPISQNISYADIPNAPRDVSDLTDDEGLLGGGTGGGLSITDFGLGFTDTLDAGKITTSKLYNENPNQGLNNQYTLEVTNGGVVVLPDGSIINGATLKTIAGNYAGITAGPASPAGKDEDSWVWVDNDGATISTKTSTDNHQWKFDNTGNLQLPVGGDIVDSTGTTVLGGGGNANTGNFTFSDDTIANNNDASIEVVGGSLGNIEVAEVDEWVPPGGPGGVWRLFIVVEDYPTLGDIVQIGDTFTTSWGTPITATITDIVQDSGDWQIHVEQDITAGHDGYDTVTFSTVVTTKTWTFGQDGSLTLPNGQSIGSGSLDGIKMTTDRGTVLFGNSPECVPTLLTHFHIMKDDPANVDLFLGDDNNYVKLPGSGETAYGVEIGTNVGSAYTWRFGTDGDLTLPEGGDILDSNGDSVLGGGSYTPDDTDNWEDPAVNTIQAALDELAARMTAFENFEIDGGNAYTPAFGELLIDGNGA